MVTVSWRRRSNKATDGAGEKRNPRLFPRHRCRRIRHVTLRCLSLSDLFTQGALDVDEFVEALEQLGIKPRKMEIVSLVRQLNKGKEEMDLDIFEMLMTRAYSSGGKENSQNNILTNGTVSVMLAAPFCDWSPFSRYHLQISHTL